MEFLGHKNLGVLYYIKYNGAEPLSCSLNGDSSYYNIYSNYVVTIRPSINCLNFMLVWAPPQQRFSILTNEGE